MKKEQREFSFIRSAMATISSIPDDILAVILCLVPHYCFDDNRQEIMLVCWRFCRVGRKAYLQKTIDESGKMFDLFGASVIAYFCFSTHCYSPESFIFLLDRYPMTSARFCEKAFNSGIKERPELAHRVMDRTEYRINLIEHRVDPLWKAIRYSRNDIAKRMLDHPELDASRICSGVITTACQYGNMEMLEILLKDTRFDVSHDITWHYRAAIDDEHLDIIERLMKEPVMRDEDYVNAAFFYAADHQMTEAMLIIRGNNEILPAVMFKILCDSVRLQRKKTFETLKGIMKRKDMDDFLDVVDGQLGVNLRLRYQNMLDEDRVITRSMTKRRKLS